MKEIEEIACKVKSELGINLNNYRSNEIEENISKMLIFPQYFFKKVVLSVLLSLFVFLLSFFLLEFTSIGFVVYLIIGAVLFVVSGITLGFLRFLYSIESDVLSVFNFSADLISNILKESKDLTKKEDFLLLYKGVVMVIVYPIVSNVIKQKAWVLAGFVNRIIYKVFNQICKVKFEIDIESLYSMGVVMDEVKGKVSRTLKKVIDRALLPIKIVLAFFLTVILILMMVL